MPRYRYIVSDGPPDAIELNRLWNDYATGSDGETDFVGEFSENSVENPYS